MIPDESAEVEMIETRPLVPVDFFIESVSEGVTLTLAADDTEDDIEVMLTAERARELGETLYKAGCGPAAAGRTVFDPPTT